MRDDDILRQSFGSIAERYDRLRPGPPDEAVRLVLPDDAVDGSAEAIPAESSSYDAVIVASMWHWVDEARALPEVARVLRPGGTFALLWNGVDRSVDWVQSLWAGGTQLDPQEQAGVAATRRARHEVHLGAEDPFLPNLSVRSFDGPGSCHRRI